jgi:hypothetical protein
MLKIMKGVIKLYKYIFELKKTHLLPKTDLNTMLLNGITQLHYPWKGRGRA